VVEVSGGRWAVGGGVEWWCTGESAEGGARMKCRSKIGSRYWQRGLGWAGSGTVIIERWWGAVGEPA
jgi:hypothetical protein